MKIQKIPRKALDIKYSGRSSDYITPSFGYGCLYKCSYCYMRRHRPEHLTISINTAEILDSIIYHHNSLPVKTPNQTHSSKWTYDISCNEDFALHLKYHKWEYILESLISEDIFPTFATKYVNKKLLEFNPNRNARIRFSLMPQELSTQLEPNTSLIVDRIRAVNTFYKAGWDVHLNFSPVIVNYGTDKMYLDLFNLIDSIIDDSIKPFIQSEVILLTHNKKMHEYNLKNKISGEEILWQPERQEEKISSYGSKNLRYQHVLKQKYIEHFKTIYNQYIPWCNIRYIF